MFISFDTFAQFETKIILAEIDSGESYPTWAESVRSHGFKSFRDTDDGFYIDDIEYTWFVLKFA